MPHLNLSNLIKCLNNHSNNLYAIYCSTNNIELSDAILAEQTYVNHIIRELKALLSPQ